MAASNPNNIRFIDGPPVPSIMGAYSPDDEEASGQRGERTEQQQNQNDEEDGAQ